LSSLVIFPSWDGVLASSGAPDFHIVFVQNDLFMPEMAQAWVTGKTEPVGESVTRSRILFPAQASAQRATQGKLGQSEASPVPLLN